MHKVREKLVRDVSVLCILYSHVMGVFVSPVLSIYIAHDNWLADEGISAFFLLGIKSAQVRLMINVLKNNVKTRLF